MSQQAHHLKVGTLIYVNKTVYQLVSAKEVKSTGGHSVHCTVDNFMTGHRTKMNFALHHHVRVVEPETTKYSLTMLLDGDDERRFLSLMTDGGDVREDFAVTDPMVRRHLEEHFETSDEPMDVTMTRVHVEPLHRVDKEVTLERLTRVPGLDLSHRYDHHHGHHHGHKNQHH